MDRPSQDSLDALLDRFEAAWDSDTPPRIEDFLPEGLDPAHRVDLLRRLVNIDLGRRLLNRQDIVVETYLERFAQLAADPEAVVVLAAREFFLRKSLGWAVDLEDYLRRFPQHAETLRQRLQATAEFFTGPPSGPEGSGAVTVPPPPGGLPQTVDSSGGGGADENAVPVGPAIPGYEFLGFLGRGGMGVVFQARQTALDRLVAVKVMLHAEYAGKEERRRFHTEARAVAQLQHPNIVQIFEIGEHQGVPYFTLEFCGGGSLDRKLADGPLEPREAAALVEKLARTIHAAHLRRIIHRDLKPANVLLSADGEPKVTDFGLAKRLDQQGQTQSGAVLGTPSYMAPEQAGGRKDVGPAADVWALGAILYECLAGRPPFQAGATMDTLMLVLSEEAAPVRRLRPDVPKDLELICHKCLKKDPKERYATAEALADDLRRFLAGEPVTARPAGRVKGSGVWKPVVGVVKKVGWKPFVGIVGLGFLLGMAMTSLVLLRAPPPGSIQMVLIGAGYEDNLAVPHNVPGVHGLDAMARWAEGYTKRIKGTELKRARLTKGFEEARRKLEAPGLFQERVETFAVYISAHGVAVPKDGVLWPHLVADDDDLADPKDLIPLEDVLDELGKFPKKTRKLLILDCTSIRAHWPLGMLHNDFARALKGKPFSDRVAAIPNLTVLCASDEDQRSWADLEWGQTAFSHFVVEGLQGKADGAGGGRQNSRVDARELCAYVRDKVEHWAKYNRARRQRPLVLGEERARNTELVVVSTESGQATAEADAEARTKKQADRENGRKQLEEKGWKAADKLQSATPHPAVYTPHLWRRYLETLLRAEELLRWAEPDRAGGLLAEAQKLQGRIEQEGSLPGRQLDAGQLTLAMPAALGLGLTPEQRKDLETFDTIWRNVKLWKDDKDLKACLALLSEAERKVGDHKALVRARALEMVLHQLADNPEQPWQEGLRLLESLDPGATGCRPAEVHYLLMLQPDAKPTAAVRASKEGAALVSEALHVRLLAEQAALGFGQRQDATLPAYSEEVRPWIKDTIAAADKERRFGEDLLFTADPREWQEAQKQHFRAARDAYTKAQATAQVVRLALFQRDLALALLPYYTRWVGERNPDEVAFTEKLWGNVHQLRKLLDQPKAEAETLAALEKLAQDIDKGLQRLREPVETSANKNFANAINEESWHEIEATLAVPFLNADQRRHLDNMLGKVAQGLANKANQPGGKDVELREDTPEKTRAYALRQGRLALAVLGPQEPHKPAKPTDYETANADDVESARKAIDQPAEGEWYRAVDSAGMKVGLVFNRLWKATEELTSHAEKAELKTAATDLLEAAQHARQMDGWAGARLQRNPIGDHRSLLLHDLMCWQAERTYLDFWADKNQQPAQPFYFQRAGDIFLKDAEKLVDAPSAKPAERKRRLEQVDHERRRIDKPPKLVIEWAAAPNAPEGSYRFDPGTIKVTDEPETRRYYRLLGPKPEEVPGYPVAWVEADPGLSRPAKEAQPRKLQFNTEVVPITIAEGEVQSKGVDEMYHVFRAFFRGHHPTLVTPVVLHPTPNLRWVEAPVVTPGRVAVQTQKTLYDALGVSNAAVAIVLDFSGSMLDTATGDWQPKYVRALEALESVLNKLPEGVSVGLFVFGAEQFKDKEGPRNMGWVWKPEPWTEAERDKKIKELKRLKPLAGAGTPLIRAIFTAADKGFPDPAPKVRSLVVLTDGGDNFFYAQQKGFDDYDADLKERYGAKTIKDILKSRFRGQNIQINAIAYDIGNASPEEKATAKEFQGALKDIDGQYFPADDFGRLKESLERSLLNMFFRVDPPPGIDDRGYPQGDLPITRIDLKQNPRWVGKLPRDCDIRLPSIRVAPARSLHQRIAVFPGDALLLDLVQGPYFRRAVYADCEFLKRSHDVRTARKGDWWLAGLQNQLRAGEPLTILASLEKEVSTPVNAIRHIRPDWAWFEVPAAEKGQPPPALVVNAVSDYPAPAWSIKAEPWPARTPSTLAAWWADRAQNLRDLQPVARIPSPLKAPPGTSVRIDDPGLGAVRLERIGIEPLKLEVQPGQVEERECLVVRLSFEAAEPFFVRVPGWGREKGQEHRFYRTGGKYTSYTGIFWPIDRQQAEQIAELELYSVGKLKKAAGQLHVDKLELGVPTPDSHP
jgi:hypothetical protein